MIHINRRATMSALQDLGFDKEQSDSIKDFPEKFFYPNVLKVLMNLDEEQKAEMILLIGRLKIVDDCGDLIPELQAKLGKRQIFKNLLCGHNDLSMTIQKLIDILD